MAVVVVVSMPRVLNLVIRTTWEVLAITAAMDLRPAILLWLLVTLVITHAMDIVHVLM